LNAVLAVEFATKIRRFCAWLRVVFTHRRWSHVYIGGAKSPRLINALLG
jgi:hypothetical protein